MTNLECRANTGDLNCGLKCREIQHRRTSWGWRWGLPSYGQRYGYLSITSAVCVSQGSVTIPATESNSFDIQSDDDGGEDSEDEEEEQDVEGDVAIELHGLPHGDQNADGPQCGGEVPENSSSSGRPHPLPLFDAAAEADTTEERHDDEGDQEGPQL